MTDVDRMLADYGVKLPAEDEKTIRAFAAFLKFAGKRGPDGNPVTVHPEWHSWLTGGGPTPDPDSPVGPA